MLDPIHKTIDVPCHQQKAFEVFLHEMGSWWPLDRFSVSAMQGRPAKTVQVEPRPGGAIVEIGPDDEEYRWGAVREYEPYSFFSMDFHIPHPSEERAAFTLVEVRFSALADGATRVDLTQSGWEAFEEIAAMLQGGYGTGWSVIFEQSYRLACGGEGG